MAQPQYLIGVDLGTSSTKAALYRPDGTLVAEAAADVPLYYPSPGVVEQENDDFYRTAAETVGRCVRQSGVDPRHVAAIAFDSQMAGIGAIDEKYEPAIRFDSWLDMRCQPYIAYLNEHHAELITQLTGCAPTCDHGPKILWWQNERPDDYGRVAKFVTPSACVAGKMAGLPADRAFMDYTFIHFSGLADNRAGAWSAAICDTLGVPMDVLPEIVEPWRVIGEVNEAAARDFALAPGTPIAAGCGDTAANALGAGIVRPGQVFDVAGTASVLAGCTDRFVADTRHRALLTMRSVIPGLWNPLAYIAGGGQALRWFKDQFFDNDGSRSADSGRRSDDMYEQMIAEAAGVPPGAEGLFFSPHLGGRICPATPEMRGAWLGFSWSHTRSHFFRAVLESIAYEYAYYLRILREYIPNLELTEARAVGGGARSDAWNGIKADVLGMPYQRLGRSEFGTWGSAMIAGKAAGLFDDLAATATEHARPAGPPIRPSAERHAAYEPLVERYVRLQEQLEQLFVGS
ncbi:FGGY-family carbohydrate kinase [Promineifilum sp.]|uniref:xylulokinase n=1 Tax=Promineifilum sp. TaxID=2664178 RepID=UPI0035B2EEA7